MKFTSKILSTVILAAMLLSSAGSFAEARGRGGKEKKPQGNTTTAQPVQQPQGLTAQSGGLPEAAQGGGPLEYINQQIVVLGAQLGGLTEATQKPLEAISEQIRDFRAQFDRITTEAQVAEGNMNQQRRALAVEASLEEISQQMVRLGARLGMLTEAAGRPLMDAVREQVEAPLAGINGEMNVLRTQLDRLTAAAEAAEKAAQSRAATKVAMALLSMGVGAVKPMFTPGFEGMLRGLSTEKLAVVAGAAGAATLATSAWSPDSFAGKGVKAAVVMGAGFTFGTCLPVLYSNEKVVAFRKELANRGGLWKVFKPEPGFGDEVDDHLEKKTLAERAKWMEPVTNQTTARMDGELNDVRASLSETTVQFGKLAGDVTSLQAKVAKIDGVKELLTEGETLNDDLQAQITEGKTLNDALKTQIADSKASSKAEAARLDGIDGRLEEAKTKSEAAAAKNDELQGQIDSLNDTVNQLRNRSVLGQLKHEVASHKLPVALVATGVVSAGAAVVIVPKVLEVRKTNDNKTKEKAKTPERPTSQKPMPQPAKARA